MILFTRHYKPEQLKVISFFNEELKLSQSVKYLGVILDPKLSWKAQMDSRCNYSFLTAEKRYGSHLGYDPKSCVLATYCCYSANVLIRGSYIWWSRTTYKTKLEHLQRLACLYISGAV